MANIVVHSVILEYKYKPLSLFDSVKDDIVWIVINKPQAKKAQKQLLPQNFAECLSLDKDKKITSPISYKQASETYLEYMEPLYFMFENLKARINEIRNKVTKEKIITPLVSKEGLMSILL